MRRLGSLILRAVYGGLSEVLLLSWSDMSESSPYVAPRRLADLSSLTFDGQVVPACVLRSLRMDLVVLVVLWCFELLATVARLCPFDGLLGSRFIRLREGLWI